MWALLFSGSVFSQEINSGKTKTRISNQNQLKLQERSSIFAQRKMQMFVFDLLSCCEVGVNSIISHALEFARYFFFVLAWPLWLIMRPLFPLRSHRIIISVCCFIDGVIFPFFFISICMFFTVALSLSVCLRFIRHPASAEKCLPYSWTPVLQSITDGKQLAEISNGAFLRTDEIDLNWQLFKNNHYDFMVLHPVFNSNMHSQNIYFIYQQIRWF